ncbi:MAG: SRPBCC family protein [Candidatus Krumholzibacteriia bacterium]
MDQVVVNRSAPVVGRAEAVITAPVEVVWDVLSDLEGWPRWNPSVSKMRLDGPLAVGTSFAWVGGGSRITSKLEQLDRPRRIAWSGKTFGIRAVHVWEFRTVATGTSVRTEESFDGWIVRLLPGIMRRMLDRALRDGLDALKREAEAGPGGRPT